MPSKRSTTPLDRFTVFVGIAVPLTLLLGVSVYVAHLVSSGAFTSSRPSVHLIVAAWVAFAMLCASFVVAMKRGRKQA